MLLEIVTMKDKAERIYDEFIASNFTRGQRLIETLAFKYATLTAKNEYPRLLVARNGSNVVGVLPVIDYEGKTQIMGQYFGEGYRLNIAASVFESMVEEISNPSVLYCGEKIGRMIEMEEQQAWLPILGDIKWYTGMFGKPKHSKEVLREAMSFVDVVNIVELSEVDNGDLSTFVRLSQSRFGEESLFRQSEFFEMFRQLLGFLERRRQLVVLRFRIGNHEVGIAYLMVEADVVTYLDGYFESSLSGFGKFMYLMIVDFAIRNGVKEVNALSPMSDVKKKMKFLGRPLYECA
jgi:hypothetical protein